MSNNIYTNLDQVISKIDVSRLSRDFQKYPLKYIPHSKNSEPILESDLKYLFLEINLTKEEIAIYLNCIVSYIFIFIKKYNIHKSQQLLHIQRKNFFQNHYGVDNISQLDYIKEKKKQTFLDHFGVEHYNQTAESKQKHRNTCQKKYGVDNPSQVKDFQEKRLNTMIEKYGMWYSKTEESINKARNTCFQKFGTSSFLATKECQILAHKVQNIYKKGKSSKEEQKIYNILLKKFPVIYRQYISEKYPFYCDFYIPELDLYIEYQGTWVHGKKPFHEPFNPNNIKHIEIVNKWKLKNTIYYNRAIKNWTITDPLKRQTAQQNNLNWIEFFTMEDFLNWFESL